MPKLLFVVGTRPEIIKVAPIIQELKNQNFNDFEVVNSGQHDQLIEPYWDIFDIVPTHNLNIIRKNQNLARLTANGITEFDHLLNQYEEENKPEIVIAQGDTTTVMISAMVSFYHQIRFAHIEAGLRTRNLQHPFPEEYNRRIVAINSYLNFAPTSNARDNLLKEGVSMESIHMVGNTIVDAVNWIREKTTIEKANFADKRVEKCLKKNGKIVLVTCHRRENHNNIQEIIQSVEELAKEFVGHTFIWPIHANPKVKQPVEQSDLIQLNNVIITNPLNYLELMATMERSVKIITDSGGIQEEAPSFRIPVIVLREYTERQEAVDAGLSVLVGSDKSKIIEAFRNFSIAGNVTNPFGDGKASKRIVKEMLRLIN